VERLRQRTLKRCRNNKRKLRFERRGLKRLSRLGERLITQSC